MFRYSDTRCYLRSKRIKGSDLIIPDNHYTALHVAISAGQQQVVDYFLDVASDQDDALVDTKNRTALALAAYHGKLGIASKLAQKYLRLLLVRDWRGNIPLLAACEGGHMDTTRFLWQTTLHYQQQLQQQQQQHQGETSDHQNIQVQRQFEGDTGYFLILGCIQSKMFGN